MEKNNIEKHWFKLLVGVALVSAVWIYYSYSQSSALRACAEYNAGVEIKLAEQLKPAIIGQTHSQFKDGACYHDVTYSYSDGQVNSYIKNAYTNDSLSGCNMNVSGQVLDRQSCSQYYKDYNRIFKKIY